MSSVDRSHCYTAAMLGIEKIDPAVLHKICKYLNTNTADLTVQKIETNGNEVYQLVVGNNSYALHKAGRNRYISIQAQIHNVEIAYNNGLSPKCIWHDGKHHMLTEWVMSPPAALEPQSKFSINDSVLDMLVKLHSTTQPFRNTFNASYGLNWNLRQIGKKPKYLQRLISKAKQFLGDYPNSDWVNCHGDLVSQNVLFDLSKKPILIDWEFSHRNTAYWDIATLINDIETTTSESDDILRRYTELRNQHQSESNFIPDILLLNGYRGVLALISGIWFGLQNQKTVAQSDEQENYLLSLATTLLD